MSAIERWRILTAAPHRVMLFTGALQLVATLVFWAAELLGRYTALWGQLPVIVPATSGHVFLMLYALFSFFIFGFLMTTYPRWMNGEPIPKRRYTTAFVLMLAGVILIYIGLFTSRPLLTGGVATLLAGFGVGWYALWRVYRATPAADKFYETLLNIALAAGWLGMLAYLAWLVVGGGWLLDVARLAGLWWFLVPVAVTVAHRMIPFFSSLALRDKGYTVYRPKGSLLLMWLCIIGHGVLEFGGGGRWQWLFDGPLAVLALHHTFRWGFLASFRVRLLAMLHVAFAWFGIAMVLYSLQSLAELSGLRLDLGRGPLHALGIGFLGSLVIAMATRVTLGHSGRPLVVDTFTWILFWGVGLAAALRVAAEIPVLSGAVGPQLNMLAAFAWLASLVPWAVRYVPIYLRRRADGRPG